MKDLNYFQKSAKRRGDTYGQTGHKDDFGTAFDYGIYFGAERMAVTVLEHIYGQQETRKFLDRIYEEARRRIEDKD